MKVPDLVVFLVLGVLVGPVAGWVNLPSSSTLNQLMLTLGASYLLFEGGLSLQLKVLKQTWVSLLLLATVGVVITAAITASFAFWVGLPVLAALLLGAIVAPTDPAALVPTMKQGGVKDRLAQTVVSESAANDAVGSMLALTLVALTTANGAAELSWVQILADLGWKTAAGLGLGVLVGAAASWVLTTKRFRWGREAHPVVLVLCVLAAYLLAEAVHASGFLAVFVAGATLAWRGHHEELDHDVNSAAFVLRLFIFVLLGSQVNFNVLASSWWQGLLVLAGLMLVARPVTVLVCAVPDRRARWSWQELLFLCWTRETGVIPAALVGLLGGLAIPGMSHVVSITFVVIVGTLVLQATTTAALAKKLGLTG